MIKFFRKIRQNLLTEGKTAKYFKYAIGEIVLVVIGILIAVQINNLNELRKQKLVEIDVLEGIRNDILKDTVDLNFNIRGYTRNIESDSILLNHLINKNDLNKNVVDALKSNLESDWLITLHDSHFQEAKLKGLSVISNLHLRESISRLYEYHYKALIVLDNNVNYYNTNIIRNTNLNKYLSFNSTGYNINKESYYKLLSDDNALYNIKRGQHKKKVILGLTVSTRESAIKVVKNINKELNSK